MMLYINVYGNGTSSLFLTILISIVFDLDRGRKLFAPYLENRTKVEQTVQKKKKNGNI